MKKQTLITLLAVIISYSAIWAQEENLPLIHANQLRNEYKFTQALGVYKEILKETTDPKQRAEIESLIILTENSKAMLNFASKPTVIATAESNLSNFFLLYPNLPDKAWAPMPQSILTSLLIDSLVKNGEVIYYPEKSIRVTFSAPNENNSYDIYQITKINDTLWSKPVLLNANINSGANEIFPFMSPDGKALYFSSNGHYGMGGYDLFVSYWDHRTNDWGTPQNLGFPYSSMGDDYLYYNTPDGEFTLFSSNRDTQNRDVRVYVTKQERNPIKTSITEEEAMQIAKLTKRETEIYDKPESSSSISKLEEVDITKYLEILKEVKRVEDALQENITKQDKLRESIDNVISQSEKNNIIKQIEELELESISLQQIFGDFQKSLQEREMELIYKGIEIPSLQEESTTTTLDKATTFNFANNTLGDVPNITPQPIAPKIDLSFRIQNSSLLINEKDVKLDLYYQIQLFTLSSKANIKTLKGLSPVIERKTSSGKYFYSAGVFSSYSDAQKSLNTVKQKGFKTAIVTAYKRGKSIPIKEARVLEKK